MPAPHHSVFYRPDALPAAQPTASKHWRKGLANVSLMLAWLNVACLLWNQPQMWIHNVALNHVGSPECLLYCIRYGRVLRKEDDGWVRKCMEYEARPRGRQKRTRRVVVEKDCQTRKLNKEDACLMSEWMFLLVPAHPCSPGLRAVESLCGVFLLCSMREETFWRNYFYRVSLIKQSIQLTTLARCSGNWLTV